MGMTERSHPIFFRRVLAWGLGTIGVGGMLMAAPGAAVTTISHYRLGDDEVGVFEGCCPGSARDSAGTNHLVVTGAPFWSADVATSAATKADSAWSYRLFQGGPYALAPSLVSSATDNFGIEAWVKPATTVGNKCIAYNGNTGADGWGLYQMGANFQALLGGLNVVGSSPIKTGVWTHVAFVRAGGVGRLYVNGVPAGDSKSITPRVPTGRFGIGTSPQSAGAETLPGFIDEVRVFTFVPGQFNTNQLFVNQRLLAPTLASATVANVGETTAVLSTSVHPHTQPSKVWFQYGVTTNYGSVTPSNAVAAGSSAIVLTQAVAGLSADTVYHFRAVALNAGGIAYGDDGTLTTAIALPAGSDTVSLAQLLAQGFQSGPLTGYSIRVMGIQDVSSAVLTDIRPEPTEGNAIQAHGGSFRLYGLGATISSAAVRDGKLLLKGFFSLPPPLNRYQALVVNSLGWNIDASGQIRFGSGTGPGGTLAVPGKFNLGVLSIGNLALTIDPGQKTYGGTCLIGFGTGPSGGYCPDFTPGPSLFGAGVLVVDGALDELSLQAADLRKPLGTTGAYLDGLAGKVGNLSPNGGNDWFIQAEALINAGCPVFARYPWSMRARTTINSAGYFDVVGNSEVFGVPTTKAFLRYNPPYTIAAGASVNFQDIYLADCAIQVTAGPSFSGSANGRLQVPNYVPVIGGYTFADVRTSFNNSGFRGSVTVNVSPEIPSVCTPRYCPPRVCSPPYWCPTWSNPGRTCRDCWNPPCIPATCTPRVPAVSATVAFKFENGSFGFGGGEPVDALTEPWERPFHDSAIDPQTGGRVCFMCNWSRLDKVSTGAAGRPVSTTLPSAGEADGFRPAEDPPTAVFELPAGEDSVMFRLTWENPENHVVFLNVTPVEGQPLSISTDEVQPATAQLRPLAEPPGAYAIVNGQRREAVIGLPHPAAGVYFVRVGHPELLGNYSVELLRQNPAPAVTVDAVSSIDEAGVCQVQYTATVPYGEPPLRIYLAQLGAEPGVRSGSARPAKAGGIYLVGSDIAVNGQRTFSLNTWALSVPDGDYHVVVNIDDASSVEAEAFSAETIAIRHREAPAPVPGFAVRGDDGSFKVQWQPSPSTNVLRYVVAYTTSAIPTEFESRCAIDASLRSATITNVANGRPYLVTVFALDANGLPSAPAEIQRVIPTEGFGLNPPVIVSTPPRTAMVGLNYFYFPELFDADDALRPMAEVPAGLEFPAGDESQDGAGRQWTLVEGPPGMSLDANGIVQWTPGAGQVGDHAVTLRVVDLSSVPPRQETDSLVRPRWDEQQFVVSVIGSDNPIVAGRGHYRFLTSPPLVAKAGEEYRYVPNVWFPTNLSTLVVEDGPPGLRVVEEGNSPEVTNVVVWSVPADARGHRVRLRAVPSVEGGATPDDVVIQEFYLAVSDPSKELPRATVITRAELTAQGPGLRWVGSAKEYQVERAAELPTGLELSLDFNQPLPVEATLHGAALLDEGDGVVRLTPDANDQSGALILGDLAAGAPVFGFEADFRVRILPTSNPPADGFSFNWATDLPEDGVGLTEEGAGQGLTVSFDLYDNGGGEAPAIDLKWGGVTVAHRSVPADLFLLNSNFVDVHLSLTADGRVDVTYGGQQIYEREPIVWVTALTGARFGLGARTGGLKAVQEVDDLRLQLRLSPGGEIWQPIGGAQPGSAINFQVDTNAPAARAFYRVLNLGAKY